MSGSNALLNTVIQRLGTIAYLELKYAQRAGLTVASIQNKAGEFVVPSRTSAPPLSSRKVRGF